MCRQQEMQDKLDALNVNRVRIETLETQKTEQLVGVEREIETLQQQINVSFTFLIFTDHISKLGNAIASVRLSVCLYPPYVLNQLSVLHVSR